MEHGSGEVNEELRQKLPGKIPQWWLVSMKIPREGGHPFEITKNMSSN